MKDIIMTDMSANKNYGFYLRRNNLLINMSTGLSYTSKTINT